MGEGVECSFCSVVGVAVAGARRGCGSDRQNSPHPSVHDRTPPGYLPSHPPTPGPTPQTPHTTPHLRVPLDADDAAGVLPRECRYCVAWTAHAAHIPHFQRSIHRSGRHAQAVQPAPVDHLCEFAFECGACGLFQV
eukprot:364466-Chlamydomonas_euryale.AAC.5